MPKPTRVASRFVVLSDTHIPFLDPGAFERALAEIWRFKPEIVVHAGDLLEGDAGSKFDNEAAHDQLDEYVAADEVLRLLRQAAPTGARLHLLMGNHDCRAELPGRIDRRVRRLVSPERHMDEFAKWQPQPYEHSERGVLRLGPVAICHGYSANAQAEREHGALYADHNGLIVLGHTHQPKEVQRAMLTGRISLPFWICNVGTLGPLQPEWAARNNCSLWGHAVLLGECDLRARHSKSWDAELVLL